MERERKKKEKRSFCFTNNDPIPTPAIHVIFPVSREVGR